MNIFIIYFKKPLDFLSRNNYNKGVTKRKEVYLMSPKTGRPKTDKPKSIRYSVRLDFETEKKLNEYCQANGITKGEAIRQGIHLLLKSDKNK